LIDTVQVGRDHRAHDRELHELVGRAVGVGAEVEHHGVAVRQAPRHDGGTADAGHHAEHEARSRQQRSRVARGDARRRLASLDEVDGDAHRGILLAPDGVLGTLVHPDDFAGLDDRAARGSALRRAGARRRRGRR
jgi:hypothetical protein